MINNRLIFFMIVFLAPLFVFAQTENVVTTELVETVEVTEQVEVTETNVIIFSANKMTGNTAQDSESVELDGNAHVKTDEIEINADMIRMDGTDYRFITAEGDISGTNFESNFTFSCQKMTYDRETKLAVLQGAVTMDDPENEAIIRTEVLEYNQDIETALLQINVELVKDESVCTATFAVYRKDQKILEMSGNPQVKRGEDVFRAHEIVFNIDTEEITLSGKVEGNVTDESEESEDENKSLEENEIPIEAEVGDNLPKEVESNLDADISDIIESSTDTEIAEGEVN